MAELNDIINQRIPVEFDWNGNSIEIAYRPYSKRIEREIKGDESWNQETMQALVLRVALDWNLTSDGKPVPIDLETLDDLPTELQWQLFYAVQNDLRNPTLPTVTKRNSANT